MTSEEWFDGITEELPGFDADLVVLAGDPAADVKRFAQVRCTVRGGSPIYSSAKGN